MFKFLIRCVMFIAGVAFIADIALPIRTQEEHVDQHTSRVDRDRVNNNGYRTRGDTSYEIRLMGGVLSSCSVGYAAYSALDDGDTVTVRSTRLFKKCVRITRGDEIFDTDKHWKWFSLIVGVFLIAAGMGWTKGDDDSDGINIRLGW